jgi:hypothetical protein
MRGNLICKQKERVFMLTNDAYDEYRHNLPILLLAFGILLLCVHPVNAASQEKIPSSITITVDPATPQKGEGFMITGTLTAKDGTVLGNKHVYLDSTMAGANHGTLQPLWQTTTSTAGTYSFYRPPQSPSEELRVRFDGNYVYANCTSNTLTITR